MLYPLTPLPSSVSAPAYREEILRFAVDSGYELRRPRTSRPRRRFQLDYLGKTTAEMRLLRDFLLAHRLGALSFQFLHPTAYDNVPVSNTTPIILTFTHGLVTGQWINISSSPTLSGLIGQWQITRVSATQLSLNGTSASGAGTVSVEVWLPNAVALFNQDTWESPAKLMGPEQLGLGSGRQGVFSWSLAVEEVF